MVALTRSGATSYPHETSTVRREIGIRAHKRGLQNVYLATVRLYHHESKTRSSFVPEVDFIQSDLKYAPYRLGLDPFFNANLSREHSSPTPRFPESA